jgi:serine phosphatase RsbU (regulator of sigma subunit)
VIEVKGDRKSVGGRLKKDKTEKDFTTKTFELQTNDVVYLTTDGYVDQPNEEGNKFGTLKFFKEIQNIGQLKAQEQEKHLKNVLAIHSGKVKQRDDITILAFKV